MKKIILNFEAAVAKKKNLTFNLLFVMTLILITACGGNKIVGVWEYETAFGAMTYEFTKGGDLKIGMAGFGAEIVGKYEVVGNKIELIKEDDGDKQVLEFEIKGNELTLIGPEGDPIKFTRKGSASKKSSSSESDDDEDSGSFSFNFSIGGNDDEEEDDQEFFDPDGGVAFAALRKAAEAIGDEVEDNYYIFGGRPPVKPIRRFKMDFSYSLQNGGGTNSFNFMEFSTVEDALLYKEKKDAPEALFPKEHLRCGRFLAEVSYMGSEESNELFRKTVTDVYKAAGFDCAK